MAPPILKTLLLSVSPLFGFTSVVLATIVLLAPKFFLHDQVSLMKIKPFGAVNGPSIFMGILGSCSRVKNGATITCTPTAFWPKYDLSMVPSSVPHLFRAPGAVPWLFAVISISTMTVFTVLSTMVLFSQRLNNRVGSTLSRPFIQQFIKYCGFAAAATAFIPLILLRIMMAQVLADFNAILIFLNETDFIAETGNGFILLYISFAFFHVPFFYYLFKSKMGTRTNWEVGKV